MAQYEATIDTADALTLALAITAAAWLRGLSGRSEYLAPIHDAVLRGGVSQGHWLGLLQQITQLPADLGEPFEGARDAFRRGKGGRGLLADLEELLQERNRWAHGARPRNVVEAGTRLLGYARPLEDAVARAAPFASATWVLIESSSYARDGSFRVGASRVMGDHPEFERIQFTSAVPLVDNDLYFLSPNGYVSLTPFAVMRYCETCRQRELCYADRVDERNGASLKSFANGHVIFDQPLAEELRDFGAAGNAATAG